MEVKLAFEQWAYRGKCDGLVYYYNRRLRKMIARRYVKPRYSSTNQRLGEGAKHLKSLQPAELFMQDCRRYCQIHNAYLKKGEKPLSNSYSLYIRLMYRQAKALGISVLDLTRQMIEETPLPCRSIKTAVEGGLIPEVPGYKKLDKIL